MAPWEHKVSDEREEWTRRINAAQDLDELALMDEELARIGASWSGALRFTVGLRRRALKKAGWGESSVPASARLKVDVRPAAIPASTQAFAKAYGLTTPPGDRRLYAYRLGSDAYAALQRDLSGFRDVKAFETGYRAGLFVLWASEWFRRCWQGGMRRWEDLTAELGLPAPGQTEQHVLREVTLKGLQQWGRPVFDVGAKHYLATIAREGGFPAHAITDGAKGWASQVLGAIIGSLMGNPGYGEEEALDLARRQKGRMPKVFCDDDFAQLCTDLALSIVQIRREAEPQAASVGLPLTAWLGLHRPNWREALPISTSDAAADALVELLLKVEAVTGERVSAERLLSRDPYGAWVEAIQLTMDGEIGGGTLQKLDANGGRLRAFSAGPMARHIVGELALFDPPVDGSKDWSARSARPSRGVLKLPFDVPVQLDLRSGDQIVARIELPGGKPRRGQLLVLSVHSGNGDEPNCLRVIGSGSGRYRAQKVYVRVPSDWSVEPTNDGAIDKLGEGLDSAKQNVTLWSISGGSRITDATGDCYRVLCGQPADVAQRIELMGDLVPWAEVAGAVDLYLGSPRPSRIDGGELIWRSIGTRNWRPVGATLHFGHYELGWRRDGEMLDRRRIAVLPSTARLAREFDGKTASFTISGFFPAAIKPQPDGPVEPIVNGTRWMPRRSAPPVRRFTANIEWRDAAPLEVSIPYPGEASITRWNGVPLPHRSQLTLADFRDLVARSDGPMELLAELRDPHSRERAQISWMFRDELPLSAIAADVASLLLPASLDAEVVLDMNNAINTNWHVKKFPLQLKPEGDGFIASSAVVADGVELYGRSLADPLHEVHFGQYSLLSDSNHRPACLPEGLAGDWLVFLRQGERVLSRPKYKSYTVRDEPAGMLGAAMARPHSELDGALGEFLSDAVSRDDGALDELRDLAVSLRGLPPETFKVFELLVGHPAALTKIAIAASEHQRDAVLGLAQALPFAWFLLPQSAWDGARGAYFGQVASQLASLGEKANEYAMQALELVTAKLVEHEPLLAPVLMPASQAEPIGEIMMRFLQRGAIDRVRGPSWGRYRQIAGLNLPVRFLDFNPSVLDALDAPCAAAAAVRGLWIPDAVQVRHIKLIARSFPTWFSEAFAASLAGA